MGEKEKELRLTMKLSNNRLRKRIAETKLSVPEAAELAGISHGLLCGYIALRVSPIDTQGRWKHSALELCDALTVSPEYLWPEAVLAVINPTIIAEMDAVDLAPQLLSSQIHPTPLLAEEAFANEELRGVLNRQMSLLKPRERRIMKMRYGYDEEPMDLGEIGKRIGLSRERVRQIEDRARDKLRRNLIPRVSGDSLLPTAAEICAKFEKIQEEADKLAKIKDLARLKRRMISNSLKKQKARFKAKQRLIRID